MFNRKIRNEAAAVADFFEANPNAWTQYALAVTSEGRIVNPANPDAVQFCMAGAGWKLGKTAWFDRFQLANGLNVVTFNDRHAKSVQDIIDALRLTAEPRWLIF